MSSEAPFFVVTGSTGHVGKQAVFELLQQGRRVRAIVRNSASAAAQELAARGAELIELPKGSIDTDGLTQAFRGAAGVFILTPPIFKADDLRAAYLELTLSHAKAITASGVSQVVLLSSWGAEQSSGTGFILPTHDAETEFAKLEASVTFLRACYFAENTERLISVAKEKGIFPTFIKPEVVLSVVATRDVGIEVAKRLQEKWQGKRIIELEGPEHFTTAQLVSTIGKVLGKQVQLVTNPEEQCVATMQATGSAENTALWFAELIHALNSRLVHFNDSFERVKGSTTFEDVVCGIVQKLN